MTSQQKRGSPTVEKRVADRLVRMSLEEKIAELGTARQLLPEPARGGTAKSPFPQPIALAASWDPALVREVNAALAAELRARGNRLARGPVLDIGRDPRRGRIAHTFGEDPYFVGEMGVAAVQGLQGDAARGLAPGKVLAAVGHLAGPGLPAEGAEVGPAPVSERELRETYFPPFEAVVRRAGVAAVIAARSEIDAIPAHANPWLLQQVLRGEWGFGGAVLGEAGAIGELHDVYRVAAGPAEAALLALEAGVDAELGEGPAPAALAAAVRGGRLPESRIDAAVGRVLALKFRAGLLEAPGAGEASHPRTRVPSSPASPSRDARALALKAAQRSITLLKNDGVLPLAPPAAGRAKLKLAVIESGAATPIRDGLRAKSRGRAEWVDAARDADRVVLVMAETLAPAEQELEALKALGKSVIVVLVGDRPSASATVSAHANAIVAAWCLGEQRGTAVAGVLFGDVNPGGKLPVTLARSPGQLPLFYNAQPSARRGYLFESSDPLYPFGWGLSYASFELGAPRLSATSIGIDGSVQVSVDVRNTGQRAGDETVQLYVRETVGSVARPVKQLKGFQRVSLAPGERRTVTLTLEARSLAMWDERMRRVVEPGQFEVMTGAHSAQLQSAALTVLGGSPK